MNRWVAVGCASVVALVVAGFILVGYLDVTNATTIPGVSGLSHWPKPLRVAVEIVVGVPVGFGIALYVILEWADFFMFVTSPIRALIRAIRRRKS